MTLLELERSLIRGPVFSPDEDTGPVQPSEDVQLAELADQIIETAADQVNAGVLTIDEAVQIIEDGGSTQTVLENTTK